MKKYQVVMTDSKYDSVSVIETMIREAGYDFSLYQCTTPQETAAVSKEADVLITHFAPVNREVIRSLKNCRLIIRGAVGVDNIDLEAAGKMGIPVANVPDYGRCDVANHVILLMLAANKKLCLLNRSVKEGVWDFNLAKPIHRIEGKTLGLLGFGGIARQVAIKSRAFSMEVLAYDPYVGQGEAEKYHVRLADLDQVLSSSDYLSIHLPLNGSTFHLMDRRAFSVIKKGCTVINTSRGDIIEEQSLVRALEDGSVSAAALDVVSRESIDRNHPFCRMDQVILTPHSAWYSEESVQILLRSVAGEVLHALRGEPVNNLIR